MFRSLSLKAALCVASLLALGACGTSAGGGGGGPTFVGAPAGSPCDTQYHNEGCLSGAAPVKTVKCVDTNGTKTWADKGVCGAKQYCVEEKDPADTSGVKKVAVCKDLPTTTVTDAGNATDGGTTTTGDGGTTTDAGPKKTPAEEYACIEKECPTEVGACMANAICAGIMNCAKACADEACRSKCGAAALENEAVFGLLIGMDSCAKAKKCITPEVTGPVCGNGQCEAGESTATCAKDCPTTGPKCGNGQCEDGESTATCPADCKATGAKCGNEKCEAGESYPTCPTDCQCKNNTECGTGKVCNDGVCKTQTTAATCGDFKCESGETKTNCALDCDPEVKSGIQCVEKNCGSDWAKCKSSTNCVDALVCMTKCTTEACVTGCAQKAGSDMSTLIAVGTCAQSKCENPTTPAKCGDGKCESGETASSCPADCGGPTGCTSTSQCKSGEVCTAGKCVTDSGTGNTCAVQGCVYKEGATCNCDSECAKYNDCCPDYAAKCGTP